MTQMKPGERRPVELVALSDAGNPSPSSVPDLIY
jgi:hypothetical protein